MGRTSIPGVMEIDTRGRRIDQWFLGKPISTNPYQHIFPYFTYCMTSNPAIPEHELSTIEFSLKSPTFSCENIWVCRKKRVLSKSIGLSSSLFWHHGIYLLVISVISPWISTNRCPFRIPIQSHCFFFSDKIIYQLPIDIPIMNDIFMTYRWNINGIWLGY
jgi:hypothetical protein